MTSCLSIKLGKEKEKEELIIKSYIFQGKGYAYWVPASHEVANHHLLMGSMEVRDVPDSQLLHWEKQRAEVNMQMTLIYISSCFNK